MARIAFKPRRALTMIEVIVVMAIISILFGMLAVWLQRARETAHVASCHAHLKDLALAMYNYGGVTGKLPPYASGKPHEMYGSWYMHILPYVGHQDLYDIIQDNQVTVNPWNGIKIVTSGEFLPAIKHSIFPELVCASDPTRHDVDGNNTTNYVANWYALTDGGKGTYRHAQRLDAMTDGLSNIVLLAEAYSECGGVPRLALYSVRFHNFGVTQEGLPSDHPYYAPKDYLMFQDNPTPKECDKWRTQTPHSMMPVALADGSVRGVSPSISPHTWKQAVKGRGESVPGSDW